MTKSQRLTMKIAIAVLIVGTLAMVLAWGMQRLPVAAAPVALVAHKSVSSQEVAPGQTIRYTIVVTNTGATSVSNLRVGDHLDALLGSVVVPSEYLSTWVVNSTTPGYVTFTRSSLAGGAAATLAFDVTLDSGAVPSTVVTNSADVYSDTVSMGSSNDAVFTVSPAPDLQIYSPESGALVTTRPGNPLAVTGRVWAQFSPAPFPDAPVLSPISNFNGAGSYNVEWSASAGAVNYVLQQSATQGFGSPTAYGISAPTVSYFVPNNSIGTYYYRVAAYNSDGRPSRWSNVQVVTVTQASSLSASDASVGAASLSELDLADAATVAVSVSVDSGVTWHAASLAANPDGWWDWSYNWVVPEADGVQYPVMARAAYTSGGEYGEDTITVTLKNSKTFIYMPIIYKRWPPVPYTPVLNAITPSGSDYTVSWSYSNLSSGVPSPTEYQLQQASDSAFTQNVTPYTVVGTSKIFTSMPGGSYYYRVRARNSYGYGEWSNTQSVLLGRTYNFTNSTEGWSIKRSDENDGYQQTPQALWKDGMLYHMIWGKADFSILSPMEAGPSAPYTILARVDIVDSETINGDLYQAKSGMTYGIIFGGNSGTPCPSLHTTSGCLSHYYRVLVAWDQSAGRLKWSLKRIDYHDSTHYAGEGKTLIDWNDISGFSYSATSWNNWKIVVTNDSSNNIKVYMNDHLLGQATDHTYVNTTDLYFGTFAASLNELGAVATKWDYFKVQ